MGNIIYFSYDIVCKLDSDKELYYGHYVKRISCSIILSCY